MVDWLINNWTNLRGIVFTPGFIVGILLGFGAGAFLNKSFWTVTCRTWQYFYKKYLINQIKKDYKSNDAYGFYESVGEVKPRFICYNCLHSENADINQLFGEGTDNIYLKCLKCEHKPKNPDHKPHKISVVQPGPNFIKLL